jgi:glycerol uptake facilitator-like aquaporin
MTSQLSGPAPTLMVAAVILVIETVSGTHYNPAAGLAPALRGDCPCKGVPAYIVTKFAGAARIGR